MAPKPFPAYTGDAPYVFVCYAHDDETAAYPDLAAVHGQGINLWYDEGISPGHKWSEDVADALRGSQVVLFLATRASVASNHCHDEINFALDHAVPVLTVYLEDTELTPSLRLRLSSHQGVIGTGLDATERAARVSGPLSRLLDGGTATRSGRHQKRTRAGGAGRS